MQNITNRLITAILFACLIAGSSQAEVVNTYHPLHVGDRWVYETPFSMGEDTPRKQEIVVESRELNGGEYVFKVKNTPDRGSGSYQWNRVTENGEVLFTALGTEQGFVLADWDPPLIIMQGKAGEVGRTWDVVFESYHADYPDSVLKSVTKFIVESTQDTVVVPAGVFRDCIKVKMEVYHHDGTLTSIVNIWYAPNVGRIASITEKPENERHCEVLVEYEVKDSEVKQAPDLQLTGVDGNNVTLSGYIGNVVVLGFWSTMIEKSVEILPFLQQLHEEYKGISVSVIGINTFEEKTPDDVRELLVKQNTGFINLLDKDDIAADKFELKNLPGCYVIDKKSLIRYSYDGLPDYGVLKSNIEELRAE